MNTLKEKVNFYLFHRETESLRQWFSRESVDTQIKLMEANSHLMEMSIPTMVMGVLGYSLSDKTKMISVFKTHLMALERELQYPFDTFDELKQAMVNIYFYNHKSGVYKSFQELTEKQKDQFWLLLEWYFNNI